MPEAIANGFCTVCVICRAWVHTADDGQRTVHSLLFICSPCFGLSDGENYVPSTIYHDVPYNLYAYRIHDIVYPADDLFVVPRHLRWRPWDPDNGEWRRRSIIHSDRSHLASFFIMPSFSKLPFPFFILSVSCCVPYSFSPILIPFPRPRPNRPCFLVSTKRKYFKTRVWNLNEK